MSVLYFDNAATSWPKPRSVLQAMKNYFLHEGGNPGRSGHRKSVEAGRIVLKTRELLAEFFHIEDPSNILFTKNATEALNLVIYGTVNKGDHVVTTSMEHNSVMRPLSYLREEGVEVSVIDADITGYISPEMMIKAVKENTKLLIATHASNVTGTINDIDKIGRLCKERGIPFLVDAAQTSGVIPIDINRVHVDFLAFSGHKGLLGPQGTGALYRGGESISINPLMRGGTGSLSDREIQPDFSPDRYESGTLNVVGIAGLGAGIEYIQKHGIEKILDHDSHLLEILLDKLSGNNRISIHGIKKPYEQTGVLSMNIEGISPSKTGEILDREYGIQTRVGLHCAPSAHRTIGTFPDGTVRLSWGIFTKEKDVLRVVRVLQRISEQL